MNMPRKGRHSPIALDLDDESLAKRLTLDLTQTNKDERLEAIDETLIAKPENDWLAEVGSNCLYFGYRDKGKIVGKVVRRVSDMPFSDIVLRRSGNKFLTSNAIAVIKRLSANFVDAGNIHVHDGPFGCILSYPGSRGIPIIEGDRPLPYYYSRGARGLNGRVFLTARTCAGGRVVTFVKIGGELEVPEELRGEVLYLVPGEGNWCEEACTRFLPLDWHPSTDISEGKGWNLFIFAGFYESTNQEKINERQRRWKESKRPATILKVHDGIVENSAIEEELYDPQVVSMAADVAGKRVLLYRPLKETKDRYTVSRKVLKRVRRYEELLRKIRGEWPRTRTGLENCLSVTMTELIVAGTYHPEVHQRFLGLYCFLQRHSDCPHAGSNTLRNRASGEERGSDLVGNDENSQDRVKNIEENDGLPVDFVMNRFVKYSLSTKSYYTMNMPEDRPVAVSSDGEVLHFTVSNAPVPVLSTPFGKVACSWFKK